MIPQSYLDCLAKHDALLDEDFPIPHWDIDEHLRFMDEAGIATPETIRELLTITSPSHLLYGTDYPYVKASVLIRNLSSLKANLADIVPEDINNILYRNAIHLFAK